MLSAEAVWFARLDRADHARDTIPAPQRKAIIARWHLLLCILAEQEAPAYLAGGYTPNPDDSAHQKREERRVLSEIGELYGIGPLP